MGGGGLIHARHYEVYYPGVKGSTLSPAKRVGKRAFYLMEGTDLFTGSHWKEKGEIHLIRNWKGEYPISGAFRNIPFEGTWDLKAQDHCVGGSHSLHNQDGNILETSFALRRVGDLS